MSEVSPLGVYPDERVAVFIDGPNFYAASRAADIQPDYRKLQEYLDGECRHIRSYYYTAIRESDDPDEHNPVKPLVDFLRFNGYNVVTKPMKEYYDNDTNQKRVRGSMSVDLTVDMLSLADRVDHVLLFSGDSDYLRLIEAMKAKGVRVTVVSTKKMVSDEIRAQADRFIDITTPSLMKILARDFTDR